MTLRLAGLGGDELARWMGELTGAVSELDHAVDTSVLPPEPSAASVAALDPWLRDLRRVHW